LPVHTITLSNGEGGNSQKDDPDLELFQSFVHLQSDATPSAGREDIVALTPVTVSSSATVETSITTQEDQTKKKKESDSLARHDPVLLKPPSVTLSETIICSARSHDAPNKDPSSASTSPSKREIAPLASSALSISCRDPKVGDCVVWAKVSEHSDHFSLMCSNLRITLAQQSTKSLRKKWGDDCAVFIGRIITLDCMDGQDYLAETECLQHYPHSMRKCSFLSIQSTQNIRPGANLPRIVEFASGPMEGIVALFGHATDGSFNMLGPAGLCQRPLTSPQDR